MSVVLDTNVLIDNPEAALQYDKVILPYTVLAELDNHKRNPDLKRAAQAAIKCINEAVNKGILEVVDLPKDLSTPDEWIVKACVDTDSIFISQDIGAKVIAKANGVKLGEEQADDSIDYNYKGYVEVDSSSDVDYETTWKHLKEVMPVEVEDKFGISLKLNQYLIVQRNGNDVFDIWKESDGKIIRISQSAKPLKSAGIIDTPLDAIQQCAIDAVIDPSVPLTVLDGTLGTGKTILSLMGALATVRGQNNFRHYNKILVTRPPIATDSKLEVGFLPGTLEDKLGDWIGGVKSNLKFLYEKNMKQANDEEAEGIFQSNFEMINLASIQGVSLHDCILIVDEYQLLDTESLKLVLSRIAQGAKVVLVGDTAGQTYGINRSNEGFKTLYRELGNDKVMSFIRLENIYRSKLSEFVDRIFRK